MQRTLDITVEYAKTRKQFGKPIGTFQAVQHQCADMYLETESSRSAVYYAGWALEENSPDASIAVSIAKMYASDAARTVGNRGIQIHGGMGFTWENDRAPLLPPSQRLGNGIRRRHFSSRAHRLHGDRLRHRIGEKRVNPQTKDSLDERTRSTHK